MRKLKSPFLYPEIWNPIFGKYDAKDSLILDLDAL